MMKGNFSGGSELIIGGRQWLGRTAGFYLDGFRSMGTGKTLWKIILLKIVVFITILKVFFPNYLQTHFSTDQQRADHVLTSITRASTLSNCKMQGGR